MFEIKDDEINVDRLMLSIREAARRKVESMSSSNNSPAQSAAAPASLNSSSGPLRKAFSLSREFHQRSDDHYTTGELLKYYDKEFIENAYRAILKREPDRSGLDQYLEHLRGGRFDRIDILARLRSSIEGREKNVNVEGLFWPATLRRLYRLPAIGYFIQWLVELMRLPVLMRNQRQFEAYSHIRQERLVAHINHVSEETYSYFHKLELELNQLAEMQEQKMHALNEQLEARALALAEQFEARAHALDEKVETKAQALEEEIKAETAQLQALFQVQAGQFKTETKQLAAETEQLAEQATQLQAQANRFSQRLQATRTELAAQERRTLLLLDEARKLSSSPSEPQQYLQVTAEEERHFLDAFYSSFENHFRGSREEIMGRLQVYLPVLHEANVTTDILDIGCGRGEWLEVLQSAGLQGRGVDTNRVQIEWCRSRKLEAINSDAIAYLREVADGQLQAVTGFHIIEHLEFESLLSLLDEIMRTLKPGGLVIFETPNPENVSVANHNFYVDPTHQNPLPIPLMKFLLDARGFGQIEIIRLHPSETPRVEGSTDLVGRFNEYFYGPMDYAIIGRKV